MELKSLEPARTADTPPACGRPRWRSVCSGTSREQSLRKRAMPFRGGLQRMDVMCAANGHTSLLFTNPSCLVQVRTAPHLSHGPEWTVTSASPPVVKTQACASRRLGSRRYRHGRPGEGSVHIDITGQNDRALELFQAGIKKD
jgi:hypothetical protein